MYHRAVGFRQKHFLALRAERQCPSAAKSATWLDEHPHVERVFYPGLESHSNHETATLQLRNFGCMMSFKVATEEMGVQILKNLKLCAFAASLGGVRTTIQMPGTMAFLDIPLQERIAIWIEPGLVRVSVGIEHVDDIIADLDQAIKAVLV